MTNRSHLTLVMTIGLMMMLFVGQLVVIAVPPGSEGEADLNSSSSPNETALAAPNRLSNDQWREDLKFLAKSIPENHVNAFHHRSAAEFQKSIYDLHERIPSMGEHEILVEMFRIAASIGDGHTSLRGGLDFISGRFSLRLYLFSDGLFVTASSKLYSRAVGAKVVKIGRATAEAAYDEIKTIIAADNDMTWKARVPDSLLIPEILHALGLTESRKHANWTFENAEGKRFSLKLEPVPFDEPIDWVEIEDGIGYEAPLYLRDVKNRYWFEYLKDEQILYVQFNAVMNKEEESIADFFERIFEFTNTHPVDRFVLDIRHNGGGNAYFNRPIVEGLARNEKINQERKLFVIIGRKTYSAAQKLATRLEKETNALFVGESTGGSPNHYGDAKEVTLPHSGLKLRTSTIYWEDAGPGDGRSWIEPDIEAELSFEDYRRNTDPALKAILRYGRPQIDHTSP